MGLTVVFVMVADEASDEADELEPEAELLVTSPLDDAPIPPTVQPWTFPIPSNFKSQTSTEPAPKESAHPATTYPPSEVCWTESAPSSSAPP
jgi:hypothetical protein